MARRRSAALEVGPVCPSIRTRVDGDRRQGKYLHLYVTCVLDTPAGLGVAMDIALEATWFPRDSLAASICEVR
jgi:hypothetical protein